MIDTTNLQQLNATFAKTLADIELVIANNHTGDMFGFSTDYSEKTIAELQNCMKQIVIAGEHIRCAELLLSDVHSEDTYHMRLKERLNNE